MGLLFREHPKAQPGGGFLEKPGIEPAIVFRNIQNVQDINSA